VDSKKIKNEVQRIISVVRRKGDQALADFTKRFDKISLKPQQFRISPQRIERAYRNLDSEKRRSLDACARRIQEFHWYERKHLPQSWTMMRNGVRLGQIYSPLESVGIYVPGGQYSYPSTLLMTAIPARLAGVPRRVAITPPVRLTDEILAAAKIAGVTDLYQIGGPAGIVALAIGTKTIPKVDLIVGPGNALVTEAKRQLFGEVGIDLLAGPSELVVLADETAPADFVAADLAAQVEHDDDAKGILITTSKKLMKDVQDLIPKVVQGQCQFFYQSDLAHAIDVANKIAGEHVQIMVKSPQRCLDHLKNGGAFFIDQWSPAVMGDYWAGPSHVLPTGGSARFLSGLSVMTFLKRSSLIHVSGVAFKKGSGYAKTMAKLEGLKFHARSLDVRNRDPILNEDI